MASYADASDLVNRYSAGLLGDLCADDGRRVTESELATNDKILTALRTATGKVRASIMQADRYTADQIDGLGDPGSPYYNQESYEYLKDIVCRVAFWLLWQRKPWDDSSESGRRQAEADSKEALKMLREGSEIFVLGTAKEAGKPKSVGVTSTNATTMWSQTARGRFYPTNMNVD